MSSTQSLIANRNKLQFHSDLAFGKILEHQTKTITIGASTTLDTSYSHSYQSTPLIIGWVKISGNDRYILFRDVAIFTDDEYGYLLEVFPYTTSTGYGIYIENASASAKTLTFQLWLYMI